MNLVLLNRQPIRPIRRAPLTALIQFLADCAFARVASRPLEITVTLVDHAGIRPLKQRFWKQDVTTDVVAFLYDAPPPAPPGTQIGDVIVNVQQAIEVGARHAGETHELALYLAHGLDHLSGATDTDLAQRHAMRRHELAWLRQARAKGILHDDQTGPSNFFGNRGEKPRP